MFALAQQKFVDEAFDESAALFAQVLEADPGNVEARINRSAALAKLGDYQGTECGAGQKKKKRYKKLRPQMRWMRR